MKDDSFKKDMSKEKLKRMSTTCSAYPILPGRVLPDITSCFSHTFLCNKEYLSIYILQLYYYDCTVDANFE